MTTVVLRHNRLVGILGLPLALAFFAGLIFVGLINILSPWLFEASVPNPMKIPAWAQVLLGVFLIAGFARLFRDFWHSRHAYFQRLTLDDEGIRVESESAPSCFVPWSSVVKVESPYPFVVRLHTSRRARPIYLINNGWVGESTDFRAARELVRKTTSQPRPSE